MAQGLPRRGNGFSRALGRGVLRLFGWRLVGDLPEVPKLVAIGVPHTSNWDFVFGMSAIFALGVRVNWLGKHTLFRWPLGGLMRWLGGVPVERSSSAVAVPAASTSVAPASPSQAAAPPSIRRLAPPSAEAFRLVGLISALGSSATSRRADRRSSSAKSERVAGSKSARS